MAVISQIKTKLRPLAEEAQKYDTFDEFETAFLREIKHGRYYHVTDNPNFTIDPESGPRDMSSMAGEAIPEKGKLMITSDLSLWAEEYKGTRQYVAIIDMSRVPKEKYWQVNRGFGNEFFVDDPSQAKVLKVVSVTEAKRDAREHQKALEERITGSPALEEFFNEIKGLQKPPAIPSLQTVAEEIAGPIVQEFQKEPIYPLSLTMADYERLWKPQGWKIIFIGPTSTWRQDWGTWEAIRDIVQNCLDEAESYQWGYDDLGLWISDKGRGVAVADFLLGPPKMKPDWARGKFGEGMKISALAMVRDGYPVKIETVGRELFIVFLEQEVDGHVQSLAALWRPNGSNVGTTFHFIGYKGTSYSVGFAVNLPREAILFQAPSLITRPKQRYNQLIQADFPPVEPQLGEMRRAVGWKGELTAQSRIYARDIFMKEINSPYSYNLWSFELAPDRFAAKDEREMWRDVGRLWSCVNRTDLLTTFLQMIKEPPTLDTDESRQVTLSHLGTDPSTGMRYEDILETNKEAWQQAWQGCFGENALIRTDDRWDATVRHLGYEPITVNWDCREALSRVITTDRQLVKESQERLRDVEVIHDNKLTAKTLASLKLARAIIKDVSVVRKVGGVHAAIIPPASDRVRTAGMYGTQTEEIFISADQLERGMSTVDTTIHEMAHHTSGAEDGEEAHNAELSRLGGLVVQFTSRGNFDEVIRNPNFHW